MELTVIRHGETVDNRLQIIQGQRQGKLTELGVRQAKQVANSLSANKFDRIYSSDLRRCVDTAKYIMNVLPDQELYLTSALREKAFGIYEGKQSSIVPWTNYQGPEKYARKIPGGESFHDVAVRVGELINKAYENDPESSLLLVTHGGPMRIIKSMCDKVPLGQLTSEKIPNCAVWGFAVSSLVDMDESLWQ